MKVKEIVDYLQTLYPVELASSFDYGKVGLQFGSLSKEVKKVMITLDGTSAVVDEALENNCDMLICHHPFLFNSIINLDYNSPLGKKMLKEINGEYVMKKYNLKQGLELKEKLERRIGIPVIMWDERLTTVEAERTLMESKVRRENRKKYVDKIAAVFILQGYLDSLSIG